MVPCPRAAPRVGCGRSTVTASAAAPDDRANRFQPDGWGWRARIGILVPHADIGAEAEFQAMAPDGVSIHSARVPMVAYSGSGRGLGYYAGDRGYASEDEIDPTGDLYESMPYGAYA